MTKANLDVRERAKAAGVYIYQLARDIGVSEPTLTRKLRYNMDKLIDYLNEHTEQVDTEQEHYNGVIRPVRL